MKYLYFKGIAVRFWQLFFVSSKSTTRFTRDENQETEVNWDLLTLARTLARTLAETLSRQILRDPIYSK